jgi:hypothetical protein
MYIKIVEGLNRLLSFQYGFISQPAISISRANNSLSVMDGKPILIWWC